MNKSLLLSFIRPFKTAESLLQLWHHLLLFQHCEQSHPQLVKLLYRCKNRHEWAKER
jgi:hypothetical protein